MRTARALPTGAARPCVATPPRPSFIARRRPATPASASLLDVGHSVATAAPAAVASLADVAPSPTSLIKIPGVLGDSPFVEGAVSGFLLILFSELGDKTFFIALLLALKRPKGAVFAGTFGALAVMTVISVR